MLKLFAQVYALKTNLWKIRLKDVKLDALQATQSNHLVIVWQDASDIHKHLLISRIKYVYTNVFLCHFTLITQQINV